MGRRGLPKVVEGIQITGMADKGRCVGRDAEGKVYFVEQTAPGDIVDVFVFRKKKGAFFGKPHRFVAYSPDRVAPFCVHFDHCGGCKWQHLDYAAQLREKERIVQDAFRRIGKVAVGEWQPILGGEETSYYRNKLEFGCANRRWLTEAELRTDISNQENVIGFHKAGTYDKILQIDHCWLQGGRSNDLRNEALRIAEDQSLPFYDMRERTGLLRQMVVRTSSLQQEMVNFVFYQDDRAKIETFLDAYLERFPDLTTLFYTINSKVNEFLIDLEMHCYAGPGYIEEALGTVRFRIGPKSFFQTNTAQAEKLYQLTRNFAQLSGEENVYDLYTGIGSIALYVADACRQVVGIEEIPEAIVDAKINAELNGVDNAQFYAGDVKNLLTAAFAAQHGKPDVLITDPPRAGMHPSVVQMLQQLAAPRLVYVSCNPATQARDLQLLSEQYEVDCARPVDMFPHTSHVENIVRLRLKTT